MQGRAAPSVCRQQPTINIIDPSRDRLVKVTRRNKAENTVLDGASLSLRESRKELEAPSIVTTGTFVGGHEELHRIRGRRSAFRRGLDQLIIRQAAWTGLQAQHYRF